LKHKCSVLTREDNIVTLFACTCIALKLSPLSDRCASLIYEM